MEKDNKSENKSKMTFKRRIIDFARKNKIMFLLNYPSNIRYSAIKILAKLFNFNPYEMIYNKKFYDEILTIDNETKSSEKLAEAVKTFLHPKTIVDVGCGIGIYMKQLKKRGIACVGIEGSPIARKYSVTDRRNMIVADATDKLNLNKRFDLALCIEVAEHIPRKMSAKLAENIASLSDATLFTAAQPGQGGTDHINEQKPQFWTDMFKKHGFAFDKKTTEDMKKYLEGKKCIWWLTDNLLIFRKRKGI